MYFNNYNNLVGGMYMTSDDTEEIGEGLGQNLRDLYKFSNRLIFGRSQSNIATDEMIRQMNESISETYVPPAWVQEISMKVELENQFMDPLGEVAVLANNIGKSKYKLLYEKNGLPIMPDDYYKWRDSIDKNMIFFNDLRKNHSTLGQSSGMPYGPGIDPGYPLAHLPTHFTIKDMNTNRITRILLKGKILSNGELDNTMKQEMASINKIIPSPESRGFEIIEIPDLFIYPYPNILYSQENCELSTMRLKKFIAIEKNIQEKWNHNGYASREKPTQNS